MNTSMQLTNLTLFLTSEPKGSHTMARSKAAYHVYHVQFHRNRQHRLVGRYRHLASAVEAARQRSYGRMRTVVVREGVMVAQCENSEINWFTSQ